MDVRGKRNGLAVRGMGDFTSVSEVVSLGLIFGEICNSGLRPLSFMSSGAGVVGDFGEGAGARKGLSLIYPSSIWVARFSSQGLSAEPS